MIVTYDNRAESNESVPRQLRCSQILEVLGDREMTAREIALDMWTRGMIPTSERNFTAPRLTEMSNDGRVEPCGYKMDEWTHKNVTLYRRRETDQANG